MNNGLIAARYATALLGFANQSAFAERVYLEAKAVTNSYFQFGQLRTVLDNPVMPIGQKREIILLAGGGKASTIFEQFIDLVLQNKREVHLQAIMLKYIDLYRKQKNIHSGKLITATNVESTTEKRLISMIEMQTGGTVEIEKVVDPTILGGFLFEVDFVRMDASLAGQLQRIKSEYLDKNQKRA
jgi:F-type H+-transporting ATPase subunit delta